MQGLDRRGDAGSGDESAQRGGRPFTFGWIAGVVAGERRGLMDIAAASLTISLLTIFPPFIVMAVVNRVLQFHSVSTLVLLGSPLRNLSL